MTNHSAKLNLEVGTVIAGRHGTWTVLGTPSFAGLRPRDATPFFKVAAYWEGKDGSHGQVTLTLESEK